MLPYDYFLDHYSLHNMGESRSIKHFVAINFASVTCHRN